MSQLPPPVHGSTVMTRHLLDTLEALGRHPVLVERRFSRAVGDVGRPSPAKVLAVPALAVRLLRAVARHRPSSVVFFLTNRAGSFLVDSLLLALLRGLRVPTLLYVHTVGFAALADRGPLWRVLVRRALRSGRVVTLGPALVADVAPFVRARVSTVPNMTVAPPPAAARVRNPEGRHVIYLSNLDPEKGAAAFVRMAADLAERGTATRFSLAGAGSPEQARAVADAVVSAGLGDRVDVLGPVDETGKWRLLGEADALVFPSTYRYEAQPLTIVEAMAIGLPVVAYDTGGVRDLVIDGETGRLIPAGDEPALADAVAELIMHPAEADRLGAGGSARFADQHSADAYRAAWRRLLDMVPPPAATPHDFAGTRDRFLTLARADWHANPRDVKSRAVLLGFRLCQWAMGDPQRPRAWSYLPVAAYRFWTEFGIGLELRPRTRVGAGLTIYHGYGLVVNDHARIGAGVVLRNAVTIGQRTPGGPTPVIGDGVEIGAGALVLGDITVGDAARIGAGAVVLDDVPAGAAAVGNPARVLPPRA